MSLSMTSQWCSSLSRNRSFSSSRVCVSKSVSKSAFFTSLLPSMRLHAPQKVTTVAAQAHVGTRAQSRTCATAATLSRQIDVRAHQSA